MIEHYKGPVKVFIGGELAGEGEMSLWYRPGGGETILGEWGGTLTAEERLVMRACNEGGAELELPNGRRARFLVKSYVRTGRDTLTEKIKAGGPSPLG